MSVLGKVVKIINIDRRLLESAAQRLNIWRSGAKMGHIGLTGTSSTKFTIKKNIFLLYHYNSDWVSTSDFRKIFHAPMVLSILVSVSSKPLVGQLLKLFQ